VPAGFGYLHTYFGRDKMDIVIYMNEEDFKHKTGQPCKQDPEGGIIYAFWSMGRIPKDFNPDNDLIWFACKGLVQGSVKCDEFCPEDINGKTLNWNSNSYTSILNTVVVPCQPFRGFRYKWWK